MTKDDGFTLIVWKQSGLVCVMVSDLVSDDDLDRFKEYVVRSARPRSWFQRY